MKVYIVRDLWYPSSPELKEGVDFCLAGAPVVEIPDGCVLAVIFKDQDGVVIVQEVEL